MTLNKTKLSFSMSEEIQAEYFCCSERNKKDVYEETNNLLAAELPRLSVPKTCGYINIQASHQIKFFQLEGQCLALIKEKLPPGIKRNLDPFQVRFAVGYCFDDIIEKPPGWHKAHIRIIWPENTISGQGVVLVGGHLGLLGGGQTQSMNCYECECGFRCPNSKSFNSCGHHCNRCRLCKNCCDCPSECRCEREKRQERERIERERQERERKEQDRQMREKKEKKRQELERKKLEIQERERKESERQEKEKNEKQRQDREKAVMGQASELLHQILKETSTEQHENEQVETTNLLYDNIQDQRDFLVKQPQLSTDIYTSGNVNKEVENPFLPVCRFARSRSEKQLGHKIVVSVSKRRIIKQLSSRALSPKKMHFALTNLDLSLKILKGLLKRINNQNDAEQLLVLFAWMNNHGISKVVLENILSEGNKQYYADGNEVMGWLYQMQATHLFEKFPKISLESYLSTKSITKLLQDGLSYEILTQNLSVTSDERATAFVEILEMLSDYQLKSSTYDSLLADLDNQPAEEMLRKAHQWVVDAIFRNEHIFETRELIDKISKASPEISFCSKENLTKYHERFLKVFREPCQSLKQVANLNLQTDEKDSIDALHNKPINTWNENNICQWACLVKEINVTSFFQICQEEYIAVVCRAAEVCHKLTPRDTQILAVGMLLNPNESCGRLVQINTGEGKSLIVAILAAIHALQGKTVDVVTTSIELSKREAIKQAPFFKLFNLTVGENSDFHTKQTAYTKDIVYGTCSNFQADILRTEFQGKNIRGQRGFEIVLVDEVDNMLFDKRTQSTRLSDQLPGMDYLEGVLGAIWNHINLIIAHIVKDPNKNRFIFIDEDFQVDEQGVIHTDSDQQVEACSIPIEDPFAFIKEQTYEHIKKLLRDLSEEEETEYKDYQNSYSRALNLRKKISKIADEIEFQANVEVKIEKNTKLAFIKDEEYNSLHTSNVEQRVDHKDKQPRLMEKSVDLNKTKQCSAPKHSLNKKKKKEEELERINQYLKEAPWLKNHYPIIPIPRHLKDFAQHQISNWIESALQAKLYKQDQHYAVNGGKVIPINYSDTGVFEANMVWSNGLAQFLQIKEKLVIQPENLATNYLSIYGFFNRYGHHIYGLTGTLGIEATQMFFHSVYNTDQVIVPPYKEHFIVGNEESPYHCKEMQSIVLKDTEQWYETICKTTLRQTKLNRAVLIICKFVTQVQQLANRLEKKYSSNRIFTYTGRENFEKETVEAGEIILATNIAGRGTDLTPADIVEQHGGLHVCITFLPVSYRVELQNAGRTARQGRKGTAQLVLLDKECRSAETLKALRDQEEKSAIAEARNDIDHICLQDELFNKFCGLMRSLIPDISYHQKIKERHEIESAYQYQESTFTADILRKQYKKHLASSQIKAKDIIETKDFHKYPIEERDKLKQIAKEKLEKSSQDETFFEAWKENQAKKRFKAFCVHWQGRVSSDVMASFQARTDYIDESIKRRNANEVKYFEREALAEQWAIWYHKTFSTNNIKNKAEVRASFEAFCNHMIECAEKQALVQNPFFDVKHGNICLSNKRFDEALHAFECAINKDPNYSLYAHYNKANTHLSVKKNKGFHQQQAKKHLKAAQNLIDSVYRPRLIEFNALLTQVNGGGTSSEHIQHHMDILNAMEQHVDAALDVIKQAKSNEYDVEIVEFVELKQVLKSIDPNGNYSSAIEETRNNGMRLLFIINEKTPRPWLNIVSVFLIGIAQIAAGILVTSFTFGIVGTILICEGINDICFAIKAAITGSFSWASWCVQKAVSLAISVICAGWSSLKVAAQNIRETAQITTCVMEGVVPVTFKTGLKVAGKQIGMALGKGVAKECLKTIADFACDQIFMKHVDQKISEHVFKQLKEALDNNELIQKALQLDLINNDNFYQNLFIKLGRELLTTKTNHFLDALKGISVGVLTTKIEYSSYALLGLAIAKTLADLATFTDGFVERFSKEIKQNYQINIDEAYKSLQEETESPLEAEQILLESAPQVDLQEENLGIHTLHPSQTYSSRNQKTGQELQSHRKAPSDSKHISFSIKNLITNRLMQSINENVLHPVTNSAINYGLDEFTKETKNAIEAQRKAYREKLFTKESIDETGPPRKIHCDKFRKQIEDKKKGYSNELSSKQDPVVK